MRIGIFIPTIYRDYDRVQSALWIRALQMIDPLKNLGCEVSLNNPFKIYDVAIYHRGMQKNSFFFMKYLKKISKRVYWDTCVDYFSQHEAASIEQVLYSRKIASIVDGVCVPTIGIAENAKKYSRNVFVMPDPINCDHFYEVKKNINFDNPTFGWSGVACKAIFLEPYAKFLNNRTNIISESPPNLSLQYTFKKWSYMAFPKALLQTDVAFLPRALGSTYTLNNSSFKALVFASLGIPIIANRLPSYELLSEKFPAISFLEDYGDDPYLALESLKNKSPDPKNIREEYSHKNQAKNLLDWIAR